MFGGWRRQVIPHRLMLAIGLSVAIATMTCGCSSKSARESAIEVPRLVLRTPSGSTFTARLFSAGQQPGPMCILLTMPGGAIPDWEPLVNKARPLGYSCLVVDVTRRDTDGSPVVGDVRNYTPNDWYAVLEAIGAAKAAALEKGADPNNLALGGAGVTANLALRYAHEDRDIQAAILLSPGMEYQGIAIEDTIRKFGNRPLFIAVAEGDAYAHSSSMELHAMAEGYCELRVYDGAAHGTDLFGASGMVAEQIVLWLKPIFVARSA